jgi:hypothetical protein
MSANPLYALQQFSRPEGAAPRCLCGCASRAIAASPSCRCRSLEGFPGNSSSRLEGYGDRDRSRGVAAMTADSMDLRVRVLADSEEGVNTTEIARKQRVSPAWVRRLKQRCRETGDVAPRRSGHAPGPRFGRGAEHTLAEAEGAWTDTSVIVGQPKPNLPPPRTNSGCSVSLRMPPRLETPPPGDCQCRVREPGGIPGFWSPIWSATPSTLRERLLCLRRHGKPDQRAATRLGRRPHPLSTRVGESVPLAFGLTQLRADGEHPPSRPRRY